MSQHKNASVFLYVVAVLVMMAASAAMIRAAAQLQFDRTPFDVSNRASTKGAPAAKFVVVEFTDYQCPFCAAHATEALPEILKEFVETGKLRYVVANLPLEGLHPFAAKAAQAAECAGLEGKFWEMHDLLFLNQKMVIDTPLSKYAAALNLEEARFDECLKTGKTAPIVLSDSALAARLSIRGTPTFVFGEIKEGRIIPLHKVAGALPFAVLKNTIEELLSGKMKRMANEMDRNEWSPQ